MLILLRNGRFQVLYLALKTLKESGHEHVYAAVEKPLLLAQSAAVLEILHGLVGEDNFCWFGKISNHSNTTTDRFKVVRSLGYLVELSRVASSNSALYYYTTLLCLSLLCLSYNLHNRALDPVTTVPTPCTVSRLAPSLSDTPYTITCYVPYTLLLRTNMTSGLSAISDTYFRLTELPVKESEKYCIRMPNKWNFSFDYFYFAILVLGIYVPGSPHMYTYMLGQRKKALTKSKRE
ncbi:protein-tyrosine phosphatase-like, PTPLA [Actinidia rufa]|uniref:Very-long-chain (3R)-3-hydroxyacyl-CoA dehydratase n=1 Tax=Actinidia rufa TaxID=165716 RepID=A0A7J0DPA4_9ERIC|nr:protein-tyrosine phosphatase-like, PTPLA [Actinidia rufa]